VQQIACKTDQLTNVYIQPIFHAYKTANKPLFQDQHRKQRKTSAPQQQGAQPRQTHERNTKLKQFDGNDCYNNAEQTIAGVIVQSLQLLIQFFELPIEQPLGKNSYLTSTAEMLQKMTNKL